MNTGGKSSLIQAIQWCAFHESPRALNANSVTSLMNTNISSINNTRVHDKSDDGFFNNSSSNSDRNYNVFSVCIPVDLY